MDPNSTVQSTGPAAKKWGFFKWFIAKKSSENVVAELPAQSTSIKTVSLQQLYHEGMIPDELKRMTLSELVENGHLAPDLGGNITVMYNSAKKSCSGEAVACYKNAIHGLKGCQELCMAAMVLLTMIAFLASVVLGSILGNCNKGSILGNCNKGKKIDHSN